MTEKIYNVLFLCTGNSARSIFAESLINRFGRGKFRGFSAGSHPRGEVNPFTILELKRNNYIVDDLRSKDWSEFSAEDAPEMDFVFSVCDKAAAEMCPVWPGQPMTAHWGIKDPAAVEGSEIEKKAAFVKAFNELQNRISIFVNLPITSLDKLKLQEQLDLIGNSTPKTSKDTAA
ncbi:MAG: arsenate reductase ArsC [Candidatus Thiodiazotropha endolucinida]|nr:arsenate reductase ArsC [Candidatus Thiodiazotropha taylori]MCW4319140.1 arsenate reductase ArsC [Candidatus Thiodiazotropha taylori]